MRPNLVVVGNISQDTISYNGIYKECCWGGAGLNISVSAAQLGERPKLISIVGEDALDLLSLLEKKVDISFVKVSIGRTCRFDIQYLNDGTLQNIGCDFGVATGLNLHFQTIDLPLVAHYHVSCRQPLIPEQILPRVMERALSFSLDFILSSARQQMTQSKGWIGCAKYVFINSQEFEILEGLHNIGDIETLIITSGNQPVRVLRFGSEILHQACSDKVFYDVTGAGDVFIGAFLASQLNGNELSQSVDSAIVIAQKSLSDLGIMQFLH